MGKYGAPAPGTEEGEDAEKLEICGPDAGDDIADIKKIQQELDFDDRKDR